MPTLTRTPRVRKPRQRSVPRERRETRQTRFVILGHPELDAVPPEPVPGVQERIASVMPWITREATRIVRNLTPRQRARIGLDDLIQEAWVALLSRDHAYDPVRHPFERGGYLGFTMMIVRRHFRRVLGSAYPVRLPKDACDGCKAVFARPDVAEAIKRATGGESPVPTFALAAGDDPTFDDVERRESARLAREAISDSLVRIELRSHTIRVLCWSYGILDTEPKSNGEQAAELGISAANVISIRMQAERGLKTALAQAMAV